MIHVVISEGQSNNPAKRKQEDDIASALAGVSGVRVLLIPNLYDLTPDGNALTQLKNITGDIIVLAWLFERATHWILDRNSIRGQIGETELRNEDASDDDEEDSENEQVDEEAEQKDRVIDRRELPQRTIYCLDLRLKNEAAPYVAEITRIVEQTRRTDATKERENLLGWINGQPRPEQLERYLANGGNGAATEPAAVRVQDEFERRWYPVIDYSRCTNCMECIDFCLFGVYGVDRVETILVEQPDNCRKGCPACSRVCPENAIIFPQHKTPAIAGAPAEASVFKIDLSRLFGAPDADAVEVAVRERDEQLLLAGRDAVGATVGIPKRQEGKTTEGDDLDQLLDKLDDMDL